MDLADFIAEFPDAVRRRGAEYLRIGAVTLDEIGPRAVKARVAGTAGYRTSLNHQVGRLVLSCSCPFFQSEGPCKHLWATILAADARKGLAALPTTEAIELEPPVDDDDDLDDRKSALRASFVTLPKFATRPAASPKKERPPPPPPWKDLLLRARNGGSAAPARAKWSGRLLYVVDVERSYGNLSLSLLERDQKKDGTWARAKAARIPIAAIGTLDDALDRRILPLLVGTSAMAEGPRTYSTYDLAYHRTLPPQLNVPAAMAAVVMPQLAESGRLFVRATRDAELVSARYDEGAPWEFGLRVRRRAGGVASEVTGMLQRGARMMSVGEALLLSPDGWLVLPDWIGRFESFGATALLSLLRAERAIEVPTAHESTFLSELLEQPGLPRLDLPPELGLREIEVRPRPSLRLTAAGHSGVRRPVNARIAAQLSFEYEEHDLPAGDPRPIIARIQGGVLIRRDRAAEADAVDRLSRAGFRRAYAYDFAPGARGQYDIAPKRVPAAVRELSVEGWRVEADGKAYRAASKFSISLSSGIDWFDLTATADFGGVTAALPQLLRALKRGESTVVLDDGSLGILPEEWLAKHALLGAMGSVEGDKLRFGRGQAGLLDLLLAGEPNVSVDAIFTKAREEIGRFAGVTPQPAPRGFVGELRPYQEAGLGWLTFLRRFGFGGCLADDMGLGKTVQVLAMLEARRASAHAAKDRRPSLAVVPKSLVWNWCQEATRFTPKLKVVAHVGPERATKVAALSGADLVVTTYGTMRADIALLREIEFDTVILDEAQAIKNASSESAKAARLLRGEHRLALSGTPIENHIGELWSLFEFLNPGMLGAASAFDGVTKRGRPSPETAEQLSRALRPFILRRTKERVAPELPPKHEETILCELEPAQRRLYNELRDHYRASLLGRLKKDDAAALGKAKILVLEALLRLRQAACHPGLIDERRTQEASAKLDVLLPRLEEVRAEGHKALVFSQFTSFLSILRKRLDATRVQYQYLDGAIEDRAARVARFQEDPAQSLFLISLKAGGVGLNLTAADYVFILDPWWNPAVEAQAVDRAHRIGQTKRVFVYRLLCRDTVEEKVAALQETKRGLAESIIGGSQSLMRDLDRETLELLLS